MADNLVLQLAHLRVHEYANETTEAVARDTEAMDCRDCENFLRKGIESAKFLQLAECIFRDADYRGIAVYGDDLRRVVEDLYVAWFGPRDFAERWIAELSSRNCAPTNLADFRKICEEMRDSIERKEWQNNATTARILTMADEPW